MAEEKKVYSRTKGIIEGAVSGFCPGCMHSTVHKIIGEAAEELGALDKLVRVEGVGCCGLGQFYVTCDETIAAHGRAGAVATGIKRSSPDSLVYTYQGDGDLAAIGLAETLSAANRGENFTVIFVNNGIYGMTGGQMAPTTLIGMKATTAPKGRDPQEHGYPMHMSEHSSIRWKAEDIQSLRSLHPARPTGASILSSLLTSSERRCSKNILSEYSETRAQKRSN